MKKNINKKGFTLIELLAVIVVLALVMIFAVPSVLNSTGTARKNTFRLYGEKVITTAQSFIQTELITKTENDVIKCYSLSDIGMTNSGDYFGAVSVGKSGDTLTYTLYLADGNFIFNGVSSTEVYNEETTHLKSYSDFTVTKATFNTCTQATAKS